MSDAVSLREHLEQLIRAEREVRETVADKLSESLRLQATETLRRLDELNHAHAQAVENWRTSLPRELFDQWKDEHAKWKDSVNAQLVVAASLNASLGRIESRIGSIETFANKVTGGLILVGFMGAAGVLALLLSIARLFGVLTN